MQIFYINLIPQILWENKMFSAFWLILYLCYEKVNEKKMINEKHLVQNCFEVGRHIKFEESN